MKTLLASTAMVIGSLSLVHAESPVDDPNARTTGAIAVDQEGSGMTTSASTNVETVRGNDAVTPLTDQSFEGTDTDTADLDDGTVVDNDRTPATAVIEDGQVDTDVAASPSTATGVETTSYSGLAAPMVERAGYAPVIVNEMTADDMAGAAVFDASDDRLGEVDQLMIGSDGAPGSVVIDVGGFLGMGETPVEVPLDVLTILKSDDELRVYIDATEEQLENMPRYEG